MSYAVKAIIICSVCTIIERSVPFIVFRGKEVPEVVTYLGKVLAMAIITTLVFFCIRNIDFSAAKSFAPQLISCAATVGLHLWKRNTLLSIAGGTICCMLLSQLVFI